LLYVEPSIASCRTKCLVAIDIEYILPTPNDDTDSLHCNTLFTSIKQYWNIINFPKQYMVKKAF